MVLDFHNLSFSNFHSCLTLSDNSARNSSQLSKSASMAKEYEKSGIGFLEEVKVLFHDDERGKYDEFLKDIDDFKTCLNDHRIIQLPVQEFKGKVNEVLKGHKHLILGFNTYMKHYRIRLPIPVDHDDQQRGHKTGKKMKVVENGQLPWDLLDVISRKLNFDDLTQFGSVCKNWQEFHKFYWRNFTASQEPLILQKSSDSNKSFFFHSLPHQEVYQSNMINKYFGLVYQRSSSGYLIMTGISNSFILANPFTRRSMIIYNSTFKVGSSWFICNVLLAFARGSDEFILVVLCESSDNLYVYQSRNLSWVTYSTPQKVVDFVVLHNIIYVVTDKANIGILNLNLAIINFLEFKSTPSVTPTSHVRLVSCDGQLLVLNILSNIIFDVYKIDFSTMNYVKLETLGDIAIFYAPRKKYYALSNPGMWGYKNNAVYVIDIYSDKLKMYKRDDDKIPKLVVPSKLSHGSCLERPYLDWCFRHLHYEVDYSLVG